MNELLPQSKSFCKLLWLHPLQYNPFCILSGLLTPGGKLAMLVLAFVFLVGVVGACFLLLVVGAFFSFSYHCLFVPFWQLSLLLVSLIWN